jgi:hypothetical protein
MRPNWSTYGRASAAVLHGANVCGMTTGRNHNAKCRQPRCFDSAIRPAPLFSEVSRFREVCVFCPSPDPETNWPSRVRGVYSIASEPRSQTALNRTA